MIRKVLGFALLAVVVLLVLRIALALLGTLIGAAVAVLVFAATGYAFYVVLRLFSPGTAARLRDAIRGVVAYAAAEGRRKEVSPPLQTGL